MIRRSTVGSLSHTKGLIGIAPSAPELGKTTPDLTFLAKHLNYVRSEAPKNVDLGARSMDSMHGAPQEVRNSNLLASPN